MESVLDLGMSLPSTTGHSDHEMPSKHGQICGYEGALLAESWPLPAASKRLNHDHYKMLTFNNPFILGSEFGVLTPLGQPAWRTQRVLQLSECGAWFLDCWFLQQYHISTLDTKNLHNVLCQL